jgi:hypothetical protein
LDKEKRLDELDSNRTVWPTLNLCMVCSAKQQAAALRSSQPPAPEDKACGR